MIKKVLLYTVALLFIVWALLLVGKMDFETEVAEGHITIEAAE